MQLSKILVAHDFSEPANRALEFAELLACRARATLDVVHVHPVVYSGHGDPALGTPWPTPEQEDRYVRFLDQELERVVRAVLGERAADIERHVIRGDPVTRIEALADELEASVVCLGSTGKGAVERILLGSVSQRVVRSCRRPVLTVH